MVQVSEILAKYDLRRTAVRIQVLSYFLKSKSALSHGQLEKALEDTDRVTLYRTLKTFEETGIIHKAIDGTDVARYALCGGECEHDHHDDDHAHFHCKSCDETVCLDHVIVPKVNLPVGYVQDSAHMIINGICEKCKL